MNDEQLSRLYQKSRVEEPPMALDSAILSHARKAVEKPEKRAYLHWFAPLASTAVILLTVTLVLTMQDEQGELSIISKEAVVSASEKQPINAFVDQSSIMAEKLQLESAAETVDMEQEVAATAASPTVSPLPARRAKMMPTAEAPAKPMMLHDKVFVEETATGAVRLQAEAVAELYLQSQKKRKATSLPSISGWLKRIRTLIQQGKLNEARKELKAFSKVHPDYKLPKDIRLATKLNR